MYYSPDVTVFTNEYTLRFLMEELVEQSYGIEGDFEEMLTQKVYGVCYSDLTKQIHWSVKVQHKQLTKVKATVPWQFYLKL